MSADSVEHSPGGRAAVLPTQARVGRTLISQLLPPVQKAVANAAGAGP